MAVDRAEGWTQLVVEPLQEALADEGKPTMSKARSGTRSWGRSFKTGGRSRERPLAKLLQRPGNSISRIARSEHSIDHETLVGEVKRTQLI